MIIEDLDDVPRMIAMDLSFKDWPLNFVWGWMKNNVEC